MNIDGFLVDKARRSWPAYNKALTFSIYISNTEWNNERAREHYLFIAFTSHPIDVLCKPVSPHLFNFMRETFLINFLLIIIQVSYLEKWDARGIAQSERGSVREGRERARDWSWEGVRQGGKPRKRTSREGGSELGSSRCRPGTCLFR